MEHGPFLIRLLLEVAAEAARSPGCVASVASHPAIIMSRLLLVIRNVAPGFPILEDGLRQARLLVVMRATWRDRIHDLDDLPNFVLLNRRALVELPVFFEE